MYYLQHATKQTGIIKRTLFLIQHTGKFFSAFNFPPLSLTLNLPLLMLSMFHVGKGGRVMPTVVLLSETDIPHNFCLP